ncbi:MAG: adenylosuccinate synthase [Spirochaetaceae bacterium]|nr:MAG: adenylosuccinate synthase [Spirochaetaceae bacterium]
MKLVVIGAQWGDEGKGKIVDYLAEKADVVLRYSGGANAGHTVVLNDQTFKLHLIPSGVITPEKQAVLGIGMVVDLENLFEELDGLEGSGIAWRGRVFISDRAHIVLPQYKEADRKRDAERRMPIGTTGRGIGVTYAQKAHRDGIRIGDLFDGEVWNRLSKEERAFLEPYREKIRDMVVDVSRFIHEHREGNILFEGAQGTLLDLDLGTYPFVSSGISCAAGAAIGGGIGPHSLDRVLGVFKAYSTRVGNGPFPSEFTEQRDGSLGDTIREIGKEYGVTTGRPRRCGYLDLVALSYACRSNSIDALCLTKLDVYDGMEEIKVCTAYSINGQQTRDFPAAIDRLNKAQPVVKSFPGWMQSLRDCRSYANLPVEARTYIEFAEQYVQTPVEIVSVGPSRSETILRRNPWTPS